MVDAPSEVPLLSDKEIPPVERLIVALDVHNHAEAMSLVRQLGDTVHFYKMGLELFMSGGYFELLDEIRGEGKQVMVDLKFFDVPETVASAVERLKVRGATFATVHGNEAMLRSAVDAAGEDLDILAVTVLTSLDRRDLDDLGFAVDVEDLVLSRAQRALDAGCAGVVSSGIEIPRLRADVGDKLVVVAPGIRPVDNVLHDDDQKRTATPREAFENGADYIVMGRAIRGASDPRAAAKKVQSTIAELFG